MLLSLSEKEQKDLKLFFHELFADNELGYTLFGDKPMSFCFPNTCPPHFSKRNLTYQLGCEDTLPLFRGLSTWKKINQRKNKHYSLIIYENKGYPTCVFLINKISFLNEVNKHISLFKKVYGKGISSDIILTNIEKKIISKDDLFKHHLILGIMLGYGRRNAELFQRREELIFGLETQYPLMRQQMPLPHEGFVSINHELQYLNKHLQIAANQDHFLYPVIPIAFAADPHDSETKILKKKYSGTHEQLIQIFNRDDWLEVILNKFLE